MAMIEPEAGPWQMRLQLDFVDDQKGLGNDDGKDRKNDCIFRFYSRWRPYIILPEILFKRWYCYSRARYSHNHRGFGKAEAALRHDGKQFTTRSQPFPVIVRVPDSGQVACPVFSP